MVAKYPAIPEPTLNTTSLRDSILSVKQAFEVISGQRGNEDYRAVLLPELTAAIATIEASIDTVETLANGKVSKTGDIMTGPLRVNGGVHNWPFIVRVGTDLNVGLLDAGGGMGMFGVINDVGSSWGSMRMTSLTYMDNHLYPGATGAINLGSAALRWGTVYTSDLSLSNGVGDWTIVEGEDDLFLYNNKRGKTYKFALTEVDPTTVPPKKV